jgi:hypothetical protein
MVHEYTSPRRAMRKRRFSLCLFLGAVLVGTLLVGLFPPRLGAAIGDIRLVSSDSHGLILELDVPPPAMEEVTLPDGIFTRLKVPRWAATVTPGSPEVPVTGLLIQVPPSGKVTAEATRDSPVLVPGLRIPPVPDQRISDSGTVSKEYGMEGPTYAQEAFYPAKVAEIERVGIIRGTPVARVTFSPFQWNPATKELRYFRKVTVKVFFEETLGGSPGVLPSNDDLSEQNAFSRLLAETIVNYRPPLSKDNETDSRPAEAILSAASTTAVRIAVEQNGIYRITWNDLRKKGIAVAGIKPATFKLHNLGNEVAIRVAMKGRRFASGDYLEFYGKGISSAFTGTNVYWLSWGGKDGKRMKILDGTVTGQAPSPAFFVSTIRFEENHVPWGLTPGAPDSDFWFWERIDAPSTKHYSFTLSSVRNVSGTAAARVCFRGRTTASPHPDHHTRIALNGTVIGDAAWDDSIEYVQEMEVPLSMLKEGANTLTVQSPGDTGAAVDTVYLNWFQISYPRSFQASGGELAFSLEGDGRIGVTIGNLNQSNIDIYDITDPVQVAIFANYTVKTGTTGYDATLEDDVAGQKTLLAVTESALKTPSSLEVWRSPNLKGKANKADYILITPREFLASLNPLVNFRRAKGLMVKAVAIEDIYNEFSCGIADPRAIKDFLRYAYENWYRPAPSYVLLVGDGTYDYRDYLATGKKSMVPVHLSATPSLGITPDDNWYVAIEGDDVLPEMMVGRIPASGKVMAANMAKKMVNYERAALYNPKEALFAADNGDPFFEAIDENLIARLPARMTPRRVYLGSYPGVKVATQDLVDTLDRGMMLTTYAGHGDVTHWAGEGLFVADDVSRLKNGKRLTFVMTLDCLNGFFAHPSYYSVGEAFVAAADRGAIAAFSPSGLSYSSEQEALGEAAFSSIFEKGNRRLGRIATGAKIAAFAQGASEDMVRIFTLLGDPATQLKGNK